MLQAVKNKYHLVRALFANVWYRFPWRGMVFIGVTGTDGKTTTSSLIYHVLNQAGYKAALVSTVAAVIDGKPQEVGFHVTTPRIFALRKYIREAKKKGTKYFVLEVTSHALDQNRAYGIPFAVGVLTNITREHLDYHKTYDKYVKAKVKLLKHADVAVINKDDMSYLTVKKLLKNHKVVTYGIKKDSHVNPHNFKFTTKLLGRFNEYNSLAAITVLQQLGVPEEKIKKGIASFKAPIGRQDIVYDKDFKVIIDFAHTPNSFASILPELKKMAKHRLIHVFGSAGQRDKKKRPEMGKISAQYADIIIVTAEDPRDEPVSEINHQIISGIHDKQFGIVDYEHVKDKAMYIQDKKKLIILCPERQDAINLAVAMAKKGDIVVTTGKSHEKSMNYGEGEEPWDEYEAVKTALKAKANGDSNK